MQCAESRSRNSKSGIATGSAGKNPPECTAHQKSDNLPEHPPRPHHAPNQAPSSPKPSLQVPSKNCSPNKIPSSLQACKYLYCNTLLFSFLYYFTSSSIYCVLSTNTPDEVSTYYDVWVSPHIFSDYPKGGAKPRSGRSLTALWIESVRWWLVYCLLLEHLQTLGAEDRSTMTREKKCIPTEVGI